MIAKYIARDVCAKIEPDERLLTAFQTYDNAIKEITNRPRKI